MAELTSTDKHAVSHRGVVTRKAIDVLGLRPAAQSTEPDVTRARAVKARHETALLQVPGVVALGIGLAPAGTPALVVSVQPTAGDGVPAELDGVPVVIQDTGAFTPRQ